MAKQRNMHVLSSRLWTALVGSPVVVGLSVPPVKGQVGAETGESQRAFRTQLAGCLASGGWHHLAVLHDGAVMAWGRNNFGQLGIGERGEEIRREAAVRVPGITTAVAASAGSEHSLVLLKDGTVLAWGRNDWWQHGNGTQEDFRRETTRNKESAVLIRVPGLARARAIAAGPAYSVAVLEDGTMRTCGKDDAGRLGDGVVVSRQPCINERSLSQCEDSPARWPSRFFPRVLQALCSSH